LPASTKGGFQSGKRRVEGGYIMRVDLNAKVRTRDGKDAGTIGQVVIDPATNEITDFVISTGTLLGRDILLPLAVLEQASRDGETVVLDITKEQLDEMPDYVPRDYMPPPSGWLVPPGYGYPTNAYLWPSTYQYMDPMPNWAREDETLKLNKGSTVMDADGEDIGVVEDVIFDPESGRITGFVLKIGGALQTLFGGGETVEVHGDLIDRVGDRFIHLRGKKEEIERLAKRR
jgi:sporulation protein YlmC with PRC-barrel domain